MSEMNVNFDYFFINLFGQNKFFSMNFLFIFEFFKYEILI